MVRGCEDAPRSLLPARGEALPCKCVTPTPGPGMSDEELGFQACYDDLVQCRREVKRLREAWSAAIEIDDCLRAGGRCEPGRFFDAIVLFREHRSALEGEK